MDALEERTGVSKRTISEIERGMRTPQTLTLAKLASALDVNLDDLLEEEAPKAPSSSPVAPDAQAREELNPETLRRAFQEHSDTLEHYLQAWEEAAARLRTRKVPYHALWGLTVAYAASFLWKELERDNVLDSLQPQGAFAEALAAGEDLPEPLRQEVTRLYDAIGRLTRISGIAMEADKIAREDRDSGPPAEVVNLPQWEARAKSLPPRPETTTGTESA
jgi:transcriptional regulator with XRE-family HTH domain